MLIKNSWKIEMIIKNNGYYRGEKTKNWNKRFTKEVKQCFWNKGDISLLTDEYK